VALVCQYLPYLQRCHLLAFGGMGESVAPWLPMAFKGPPHWSRHLVGDDWPTPGYSRYMQSLRSIEEGVEQRFPHLQWLEIAVLHRPRYPDTIKRVTFYGTDKDVPVRLPRCIQIAECKYYHATLVVLREAPTLRHLRQLHLSINTADQETATLLASVDFDDRLTALSLDLDGSTQNPDERPITQPRFPRFSAVRRLAFRYTWWRGGLCALEWPELGYLPQPLDLLAVEVVGGGRMPGATRLPSARRLRLRTDQYTQLEGAFDSTVFRGVEALDLDIPWATWEDLLAGGHISPRVLTLGPMLLSLARLSNTTRRVEAVVKYERGRVLCPEYVEGLRPNAAVEWVVRDEFPEWGEGVLVGP
jgi:hypothetical protein